MQTFQACTKGAGEAAVREDQVVVEAKANEEMGGPQVDDDKFEDCGADFGSAGGDGRDAGEHEEGSAEGEESAEEDGEESAEGEEEDSDEESEDGDSEKESEGGSEEGGVDWKVVGAFGEFRDMRRPRFSNSDVKHILTRAGVGAVRKEVIERFNSLALDYFEIVYSRMYDMVRISEKRCIDVVHLELALRDMGWKWSFPVSEIRQRNDRRKRKRGEC